MVRYKRYKRYGRRRSTNIIKMKFQSFMDISTSDSSMQIITVSAGGSEILKRLAPQFGAYKYYKIGNIAVKLVPASSLPVDPTGLSYTAGENTTVDPRDQLTPGMMRITNGEDIFEDLTGMDADTQYQLYNTMLLDPRWFKWMLQSGVKRHATPRYWQIGQLHQDKWPGSFVNIPHLTGDADAVDGTCYLQWHQDGDTGLKTAGPRNGSVPYGLFQTGHRGVLGWLPTDGLSNVLRADAEIEGGATLHDPLLASPPEVEVMKIILPKAHKTRYYYRMFITETVYFREPIVNFGITTDVGGGRAGYYQPLDVFHFPGYPVANDPGTMVVSSYPADNQTGGNYGDNQSV